jgi:hypothetical protein
MFEQGLKDLYEVAKLLRTNSCYIAQNNTEASTPSPPPPSSEALSGNVVNILYDLLFLLLILCYVGISCNE